MEGNKKFADRAAWCGWLAAGLACAAFAWAAAFAVWPPLDGDTPAYFGTAVEFARTGQLETPIWQPKVDGKLFAPEPGRFVYHGFLYPMVVGSLGRLWGGDVPACLAVAYAIALFGAALAAAAIVMANSAPLGRVWSFVFGFISFAGCFALSIAWFGRMESLVILLVSVSIIAGGVFATPGFLAILGCVSAALTLTSPAAGLLSCLLAGTVLLADARGSLLAKSAVFGASFLFTAMLGFAWYPFPISDWLAGVLWHGKAHFGFPSLQGLWRTWVLSPVVPFLVVTFGLSAFLAIRAVAIVSRGLPPWRALAVWVSAGAFALLLLRLSVMKGEAAYNAVVWIPLYLTVGLTVCRGKPAVLLAVMALALPSLGLARSAALLAFEFGGRKLYREAAEVVAARADDGILVAHGLFLAVPDFNKVAFGRPAGKAADPAWFIDKQAASGRARPASYEGYELVVDKFAEPVMLMGMPLSRSRSGWQYAVYKRVVQPEE